MVVWELTTGCGGFSSRGQMQTEIWREKRDAETEVGTEVHEKTTNAKGNLEKF